MSCLADARFSAGTRVWAGRTAHLNLHQPHLNVPECHTPSQSSGAVVLLLAVQVQLVWSLLVLDFARHSTFEWLLGLKLVAVWNDWAVAWKGRCYGGGGYWCGRLHTACRDVKAEVWEGWACECGWLCSSVRCGVVIGDVRA